MFQTFETSSGRAHVAERLKALRAWMAKAKIDAVLIPRADEHQGEYVPASSERLFWLTGFTGSAGIAVVTRKTAALFIDGRYTVQAKAETNVSLFDVSLLPRPRLAEWLINHLGKATVVGYDPWLHTVTEVARLSIGLSNKGIKLKPLSKNPIDVLWGKDRPAPPSAPVILQPISLSGRIAADKIAAVQKRLKDDSQDAVVVTMPDSICWLLNIRGSDVAHNPVVLAFAIVPVRGKVELFIEPKKTGPDVRKYLTEVATILPPDALPDRLAVLKRTNKLVRLDPDTAASWFDKSLGTKSVAHGQDPCILPKAIKTTAEIAGTRAAHIRDGAAVARFLAWFASATNGGAIDEITAVKKLEEHRRQTNALKEISFATISGSGPNGAIVHYRVTEATNRKIGSGELFLLDSGAQYQDGTTDITRTLAVGTPTEEMRTRYTAVLKGHIAIAMSRFPKGTRGLDLDPFARRALWDIGLDFDHGTGHGVGCYLSVHEGPQSISRSGAAVLQPGMLISNEPGFYKEGAYGIRIENVVLVTELAKVPGGDREMMAFETLTLAPMDKSLIDADALTTDEFDWLNDYHARVYDTLAPLLDSATAAWLRHATAKIV
jgi:Xaa-Pro aminopeptidase